MTLNEQIKNTVLKNLDENSGDLDGELINSIRLLAKWRALLIQRKFLLETGNVVLSGPVKGLEFLENSAEGCHVPKLLGTYEQPLHIELYRIIHESYDNLLCVGAAEGYYAVGLLRAMPDTNVIAYDSSHHAQKSCTELAKKNGLLHRIDIRGTINHSELEKPIPGKTVIICDIEGDEILLLDPTKAPALKDYDIVVECHECFIPRITEVLTARFELTHSITKIADHGSRKITEAPNWFAEMSHLDQLIAMWEWRSGPTPWLIMRANSSP